MSSATEGNRSSLLLLLWVPVILFNMLLVVVFQVLFLHTISGPLTIEKLQEQPFFAGADLRVGAGRWRDSLFEGGDGSAYVLHADANGVRKIVRIDQNRFLNRLGIARLSATDAPEKDGNGETTVRMRNLLGYSDVTIVGNSIARVNSQLFYRDANTSFAIIVMWALLLQCVESLIFTRYRLSRKRR